MKHSNGDWARIFYSVCAFLCSLLWFIRAFTVAERPLLSFLGAFLFLIFGLWKLLKKPNKKDE